MHSLIPRIEAAGGYSSCHTAHTGGVYLSAHAPAHGLEGADTAYGVHAWLVVRAGALGEDAGTHVALQCPLTRRRQNALHT